MSERDIQAGDVIALRVRFLDDLSESAVASGVNLYIFEPDPTDPFDFAEAYAHITAPTYLGEGIYEYNFPVIDNATEGEWTDLWYGTLNTQLLSGECHFNVYSAGEIEQGGLQLYINNLIEVIIGSGVQASDGAYVDEEYSFEFLTTTSPSYTEVRKVRLEVGGYVANLTDLTLQLAILEASLEADQLSFNTTQNTNFFNHARREWTTCRVASTLLDNIASGGLKSKSLGDLRVEYDPNIIRDSIARVLSCMDKWEPQLLAGGYAKSAQQPVGVVKGEYDYDRPAVGRLWEPTSSTAPYPAANDKGNDGYSRRYQNIYTSRKKWW